MLSGKRLRQYLAYAVLDQKTPPERKPPVKAKRSAPRRGPERDAPYRAFVREHPCAACGIEGRSEAAHTGDDGGMSMKASDYSCIPLCAECHTMRPDSYHRIDGGRAGFEARYRVACAEIAARLAAEWRARAAKTA